MKTALLALLLVFSATFAQAESAPYFQCYNLGMQLPRELADGSPKLYLPTPHSLCVREKNMVRAGRNYTGDIAITIRNGDFVTMGYEVAAKSTSSTMQNTNTVYAKDVDGLNGKSFGRIQFSLLKNASGKGVYLGQVSIGGSVYGLFGQ